MKAEWEAFRAVRQYKKAIDIQIGDHIVFNTFLGTVLEIVITDNKLKFRVLTGWLTPVLPDSNVEMAGDSHNDSKTNFRMASQRGETVRVGNKRITIGE